MKAKIIIGDADSLIGLLLEYDSNYKRATMLLEKFNQTGITVIYPNTAIAEAITTILRKHSNPQLASYLAEQYEKNSFSVEYVDKKIMMSAVHIFNPKTSKQNTFFDAIVAATAQKYNAEAIFSFDEWYGKLGFKNPEELF